MPVVLYGCETWSLKVRKERRLKVYENRVLRRIFGPKRDKVTGKWRRLHKEELCDVYSSPNIFRVIKWGRVKWAGHVVRMGERRGTHRVLVGKSKGKRILARPLHRWEGNIKMGLQDVGCGGMDWIDLVQGAGSCECGNETFGSIKCGDFFLSNWGLVNFSRRFLLDGVSKKVSKSVNMHVGFHRSLLPATLSYRRCIKATTPIMQTEN
jgi:hypothetical protein